MKYRRALTLLVASLPVAALAQVPVEDGSGYSGSTYSTPASGTSGTYAGGGAQAPSSAQGELFMQLQQMQNEISQLRGRLEEQENDIRQLKQQGLERYQELDRRLSSASQQPQQPASGNGAIDASGTPTPPAGNNAAAGNAPAADPANEKLYYDAAFDLIKVKDFDKAAQAFNGFLQKFPNSQYAGNAQYWLGEISLAQGDLQGAGRAFARVSQAYPSHTKVPDSLYKLADVERRLGNTDRARSALQQVVSQYPGSSAAQLAKRDLQSMP